MTYKRHSNVERKLHLLNSYLCWFCFEQRNSQYIVQCVTVGNSRLKDGWRVKFLTKLRCCVGEEAKYENLGSTYATAKK